MTDSFFCSGLDCLSWANRLTVYRELLNDEVLKTLPELAASNMGCVNQEMYGSLFLKLAWAAETEQQFTGDGWKNHLLNLIFWADNPFSRQAVRRGAGVNPALLGAARHDLRYLHGLYHLDFAALPGAGQEIPPWAGLIEAEQPASPHLEDFISSFARPVLSPPDLDSCLASLVNFYAAAGTGPFARYGFLRWNSTSKEIRGIAKPDPVCLDELIGNEREKQQVIANTEALLAGYPANNVLLYGDRGTGKSSTVKAIGNRYAGRGLRLVEVQKQDLHELPLVLQQLQGRVKYALIFIDDFSFEDFELEYKALKAVLEGSLETRPDNVLIYATSNRRNLVRESFKDRREEDVHAGDTMQEKLSLADRFGLTVTFVAPDQKRYLQIVEGIAARRGIKIDREELFAQARRWELHHRGRSGRTARQFVDYLEGIVLKQGEENNEAGS